MTLEEFKLWFDGFSDAPFGEDTNLYDIFEAIGNKLSEVVAPEPIQPEKQQAAVCPRCLGKGVICSIPGGTSYACPVCIGKGEL